MRPLRSPSTRRAWIEIAPAQTYLPETLPSPSTRRAWIEICKEVRKIRYHKVALHPEGVDRNVFQPVVLCIYAAVALHPEGVDRNW